MTDEEYLGALGLDLTEAENEAASKFSLDIATLAHSRYRQANGGTPKAMVVGLASSFASMMAALDMDGHALTGQEARDLFVKIVDHVGPILSSEMCAKLRGPLQ